ncbi:hypothetical protein V3C99_013451, partial [Haemonchus contortus]
CPRSASPRKKSSETRGRDDGCSQKENFLFGLTAVLPILVGGVSSASMT